jgi:acetoin utilization protein AcuB
MKIRTVMRSSPLVITDTDTLGNAQRWMASYKIRHLPVVGDGKLVGMLTERDLLAARVRAPERPWWKVPVRDAMQPEPQTVHPDDSLTEVAARMAASKLDAFAVVETGKLLGIITVIDVLDAEVREAMAS